MQKLIGVCLLLGLVGCGPSLGASFQKAPKPTDPMKTVVYIYRPSKMAMKKQVVKLGAVHVHDPKAYWKMELHSGGYIAYVATAGKFTLVGTAYDGIFSGITSKTVEIELQPQKEYFIRAKVDSFEFAEVTPDVGEREIRECNLDPGGTPQRQQVN